MAESIVELVIVGGRPAIRGECDLSSIGEVEAWLASFDGQLSEVDLSGVTFFDSCSLRAFLNLRRHNSNVRVVNPSASVRRVLEITGTVDALVHGSALS